MLLLGFSPRPLSFSTQIVIILAVEVSSFDAYDSTYSLSTGPANFGPEIGGSRLCSGYTDFEIS